jgi:PAS domain S-box-containing protein
MNLFVRLKNVGVVSIVWVSLAWLVPVFAHSAQALQSARQTNQSAILLLVLDATEQVTFLLSYSQIFPTRPLVWFIGQTPAIGFSAGAALSLMLLVLAMLAALLAFRQYQARRRLAAQLAASEARACQLFEAAPQGLYRFNASGQLLAANPALLRLLGHTDADQHNLHQVRASGGAGREVLRWLEEADQLADLETVWRKRDGQKLFARETIQAVRDHANALLYYESAVEDITRQRRAEQRLAALHAIARLLAESATVEEATEQSLETICQYLGWEISELWSLDPLTNQLHLYAMWHDESLEAEEFWRQSKQLSFAPGQLRPVRA